MNSTHICFIGRIVTDYREYFIRILLLLYECTFACCAQKKSPFWNIYPRFINNTAREWSNEYERLIARYRSRAIKFPRKFRSSPATGENFRSLRVKMQPASCNLRRDNARETPGDVSVYVNIPSPSSLFLPPFLSLSLSRTYAREEKKYYKPRSVKEPELGVSTISIRLSFSPSYPLMGILYKVHPPLFLTL